MTSPDMIPPVPVLGGRTAPADVGARQRDDHVKRHLRAHTLAMRDALQPEERAARSARIVERVVACPCFAHAHTVFCFVSFRSEVRTEGIIGAGHAHGKRVVVPRCELALRHMVLHELTDLGDHLRAGVMGIPEPDAGLPQVEPEGVDLVLVPGAAWDGLGYRVGYGGGFYDRWLAAHPRAWRLGIAFDLQVVERIPRGPHDVPVDVLITESRALPCRANRAAEEARIP